MTTRLWYDDLIAGFDSKLVDCDVAIISEEQRLVGLLVGLLMIMDSGIGHCLITYFRLRWCQGWQLLSSFLVMIVQICFSTQSSIFNLYFFYCMVGLFGGNW